LSGRFFKGMAAGAILGAAAGIMFLPGMDRRTRKRISKTGRRITGFTSDIWDGMMNSKK
jgi:gas vesicle protein